MQLRSTLFLLSCLLLASGHAAHADCPNAAAGLYTGLCQAQEFAQADSMLTQEVALLSANLPPAGRARLASQQQAFLRRRNRACESANYISFGCAAAQTKARLAALNARITQLSPAEKRFGHYRIPATPWIWKPDGQTASAGGAGPAVLALSGLPATPGQILIIRLVTGTVSVGNQALVPSYFHTLGGLAGAFTDAVGQLVGQPFAVENGTAQELIPHGAVQLQLGVNSNSLAGDAGSIEVAVRVSPTGKKLPGGIGMHGCAVFGASLAPQCQSYPGWSAGSWLPPPGSGVLHVLVVGAGGGGGTPNFLAGVGGAGGGSGTVVDARLPVPDAPIEIRVGIRGAGGVQAQAGGGGTSSAFGPVVARGGWGGQAAAGGSAIGQGGHNGGGGGGGGTYQMAFDAGSGGPGGTGGTDGAGGLAPVDVEDGVAGTAGGGGAEFPMFDYGTVKVSAAPGGAGGEFGSGGVNDVGDACAGGGGGGGGGGGILLDGTGPASAPAPYALLPYHCGQQGGNGTSGAGFGAGGGGLGDGMAGPGGDGTNGVVLVVW